MSIEEKIIPPATQKETYVSWIHITAFDGRANRNDRYNNIIIDFGYSAIEWNDENGDMIRQDGIEQKETELYTDDLGAQMVQIPYPDGSVREVPMYAAYLILKEYGDALRPRRIAEREAARIAAETIIPGNDTLNGVDEGNSM